jgi:SAM-dependent methyltransferase
MHAFTQFQANRHPSVATFGFRSAEKYLLFKMQELDYLEALPLVAGKEVLDIGCNNGYGTDILSRAAASVCGLDVSPSVIDEARTRYPNLKFEVGDVEAMPFGDACFDVVLFLQTIEHIFEPGKALIEINRILKPGGTLIVTTPNSVTRLGGTERWNPFHAREYDEEQFRALLSGQFDVILLDGVNGCEKAREVELARLRRRRARAAVRAAARSLFANAVPAEQIDEISDGFHVLVRIDVLDKETAEEGRLAEFMERSKHEVLWYYQTKDLAECFSLRGLCKKRSSAGG